MASPLPAGMMKEIECPSKTRKLIRTNQFSFSYYFIRLLNQLPENGSKSCPGTPPC